MKQLYNRLLALTFALIVQHTVIATQSFKIFSETSAYAVTLSGFVKNEAYWDTRQVVGAQDDQVLLYPEPIKLDSQCNDINSKGQFDMLPIQSRMRWVVEGPMIKKSKGSAVIEYDFFGVSAANIINIIRMRHAYLKLDWEHVALKGGQAYHPLYVEGIDPRTLSFNTGIPLDTFARDPQVRAIWKAHENLEVIFCASTQLDSKSDGPIGRSTTYLRNAIVPMLDLQFKGFIGDHILGVGVDYKRLRPRIVSNTGLKVNESINSAIVIAYNRLLFESSFESRSKFIFVQNGTDQNMIGGYAVHCVNPDNDQRTYINLNAIAFWNDTDIIKSKSIIPGWFIGFIKNLGARGTVLPNIVNSEGFITDQRIYGFGTDIDYLFRIAPRVRWQVENFLFGVEVEYTRAAFGTIDCKGKVIDTKPVGVTRLLATMYYFI